MRKIFADIIIVKGSRRISKSERTRRMGILHRRRMCKLLKATTIHVISSAGWEVWCGWRHARVRTGERSRGCLGKRVKAWAMQYTQARSLRTSILAVEINRTYSVTYLPKKERDGLIGREVDTWNISKYSQMLIVDNK